MLLVGYRIQLVALGISMMLVVFIFALLNAMLFDTAKSCGCFGEGGKIDMWSIGSNLVLLTLSLYLMAQKAHRWSLDAWLSERRARHNGLAQESSSLKEPV